MVGWLMDRNEFKNPVFLVALVLCAVMAVWAIAFNEGFTSVSNAVFGFLTEDFGWLYLVAMLAFVVFALAIAFMGAVRGRVHRAHLERANRARVYLGRRFGSSRRVHPLVCRFRIDGLVACRERHA